jgi:hypothetical protein
MHQPVLLRLDPLRLSRKRLPTQWTSASHRARRSSLGGVVEGAPELTGGGGQEALEAFGLDTKGAAAIAHCDADISRDPAFGGGHVLSLLDEVLGRGGGLVVIPRRI